MLQHTVPGQGRMAHARHLHTDALTHMAKKRFDKAISSLEEALRLRRSVLLPSDEIIICTLELLAHNHRLVGNKTTAMHLYAEIVTQKQARLGYNHPDVAEAAATLADLQRELGHLVDAAKTSEMVWKNRTVSRAEAFLEDFESLMESLKLPDHVLAQVDPDSMDARRRQLDMTTRADVRGDLQDRINARVRAVTADRQAVSQGLAGKSFHGGAAREIDPALSGVLDRAREKTAADHLLAHGRAPSPPPPPPPPPEAAGEVGVLDVTAGATNVAPSAPPVVPSLPPAQLAGAGGLLAPHRGLDPTAGGGGGAAADASAHLPAAAEGGSEGALLPRAS